MVFGRLVGLLLVLLAGWLIWKVFSKAWKKATYKEKLEDLQTEQEIAELVKSVRANDVKKAREIINKFDNVTKEN